LKFFLEIKPRFKPLVACSFFSPLLSFPPLVAFATKEESENRKQEAE
jgi:hypothetical protein